MSVYRPYKLCKQISQVSTLRVMNPQLNGQPRALVNGRRVGGDAIILKKGLSRGKNTKEEEKSISNHKP